MVAMFVYAARPRRPDDETLRRRRMLAWSFADKLHQQQSAHAAWGALGLSKRLKLASFILDLVRRNRGNDGGRYIGAEIP